MSGKTMKPQGTEPDAGPEEELPDEIVLLEDVTGGDRRAYFLRRAGGSERRELSGHVPADDLQDVTGGDRRAYFLRRVSGSERRELIGHLPTDELQGVTGGNRRTYYLRRASGTDRRQLAGRVTKEELSDVAGGRNYSGKVNLAGAEKPGGNVIDPTLPGNLPHVPTRVP
jgi:bifunctional DNA-binding transcriptional regulator/antitoxin component of YhaV-PrlF toxin-antitoxin module